ncbi:hypothetical protein PG996_015804 [Apiospora saccharicola]|uniref:Uncharacterized protein n=1 Tax=Apiospora saccharicola TaxID=335842 RepID=A0ABR1TM61_9PEZI
MPPQIHSSAAGITGHVGAAATPAAQPQPQPQPLKSALKRASSSPRRHHQVVHFTPRSSEVADNFSPAPLTNWSTFASPSYSSPSFPDPNQNSFSSYTISQPQIHTDSNDSGSGNVSGSSYSPHQQSYYLQQQQQPPTMMKYPPNFNPMTPPNQTAGYHPTPSPPSSTPSQQQYQYPAQYQMYGPPQSNMMPGRHGPAPPPSSSTRPSRT